MSVSECVNVRVYMPLYVCMCLGAQAVAGRPGQRTDRLGVQGQAWRVICIP